MADRTLIGWCDATWPVIAGCDHVSEGCDLCFSARLTSTRIRHLPEYSGLAVDGRFTGEIRLLENRLGWPRRWSRKPRRIFISDMADLLHKDVPDSYVAKVLAVAAMCPMHTFMVLTKRHARLRALFSNPGFPLMVLDAMSGLGASEGAIGAFEWPLRNVWAGVSCENQKWADIRIPALCRTPAVIRFISYEPALGPVDLAPYLGRPDGLDQVIAGGESGRGSRPMHPDWARSARDQCLDTGTAFFFKQWGSHYPVPVFDAPGWSGGRAFDDPKTGQRRAAVIQELGSSYKPGRLRALRAGDVSGLGVMLDDDTLAVPMSVKAAGNTLDGQIWEQFPAPVGLVAA